MGQNFFGPRRLLFTNLGSTTLSGAITSSQTSVTVAAGANLPQPTTVAGVAPFNQVVATLCMRDPAAGKYELLILTARSGDTLTLERGAEGTTAYAWPSGTVIENVITADFWNRMAHHDRFFTSRPYAIVASDSVDGMVDQDNSFFIGDWRDFVDISMSPQGGSLFGGLHVYNAGLPESVDISLGTISGFFFGGLITYSNYAFEAADIGFTPQGGSLFGSLATYNNYPAESVDVGISALGGTLV
jgi:hypothetical protein